jgi:hypothetical protein
LDKPAEDSSCGGDPGGVVLLHLIGLVGVDMFSIADADGAADRDSDLSIFTPDDSGFGVMEGDLDFAWGVGGNGTSVASADSSGD